LETDTFTMARLVSHSPKVHKVCAFTCPPLMIAAAHLHLSQDTHAYMDLVLKREQTQIATSPKATSDLVLCVLFSPESQSRQTEPGIM
jgi:hypothetical protein